MDATSEVIMDNSQGNLEPSSASDSDSDSLPRDRVPIAMEHIKIVKVPMSELLTQLQRTKNAKVSTTDVTLLCADGFVPAHSAVLRVASPFFSDLLSDYSKEAIRSRIIPVILPDYDVCAVQKVVQLMYCGLAENITSGKELKAVKELLLIFKMAGDPSITLLDQPEVDEGVNYLPLEYCVYKGNWPWIADNNNGTSQDSDYEEPVFEIEQEVVYENVDDNEEEPSSEAESEEARSSFAESDRVEDLADRGRDEDLADRGRDEDFDDDIEVISNPTNTPTKNAKEAEVVDLADESDQEQTQQQETEVIETQNSEDVDTGKSKKSPMHRKRRGSGAFNPLPSTSTPTTATTPPLKRALRPRKSEPQTKKKNASSNFSSSGSGNHKNSSSSESESEEEVPKKRRRFRSRRTAAVAAKKAMTTMSSTKKSPTTTTTANVSTNIANIRPGPVTPVTVTSGNDKTGEGKEPEVDVSGVEYISSEKNEDDDDSDYTNRRLERFMEEAKKCHKCGKTYESPKEASMCITGNHKMVRCYFCFKVLPTTETLFEHYKSSHRKSGKEGHLQCKFCQQALSFKSVSTHVISNHLFDKNKKQGPVARLAPGRPGPGRPPSMANTTTIPTISTGLATSFYLQTATKIATPAAGDKNKVNENEVDSDSDDDDDDVALMGAGKLVIKKTTATGKKIKMHR